LPYQPGDILLEKYRIEALIGSGSFAEVYLVTHEVLKQPRALKVLRRDAKGIGSTDYGEIQTRFKLEALVGAQLNTPTPNPHLLQIYDFIGTNKINVLEMEYAPGGSLKDRLEDYKKKGQFMPVEEAVQIAIDFSDGLAALHKHNYIHRDLKPSNILFDYEGRAKVADLGLVQTPDDFTKRALLSEASPHPGTPAYKSPEQENTTGILKPPSDVYALGLMLFEMLSGQVYVYLRPGSKPSTTHPETPQWLDELVGRMLSKDPEKRPWDGKEAGDLLRRGQQIGQKQKDAENQTQAEAAEKTRLAIQEIEKQAFTTAQRKAQLDAKEIEHRAQVETQRQQSAEEQKRKQEDQRRLEVQSKAHRAKNWQKWKPWIFRVGVAGLLVFLCVFAFVKLISGERETSPQPTTNQQPTAMNPQVVSTKQYSNVPPMMIDVSKQYFATVKMAKGGEFVIQLYPDKAPITVNSFVFLARQGYFDGVTFHRVLSGFMAQGGDPTGTGGGGPGYEFVNEDSNLTFDKAGVVAMANAGRDTNGSQFFITFASQEQLNGGYTITLRDPEKNPSFSGDAIENITISEK
jgi:serine/threonine protein kinase/cyclophilin family peptidyl-prolyl cis-trans isomerase